MFSFSKHLLLLTVTSIQTRFMSISSIRKTKDSFQYGFRLHDFTEVFFFLPILLPCVKSVKFSSCSNQTQESKSLCFAIAANNCMSHTDFVKVECSRFFTFESKSLILTYGSEAPVMSIFLSFLASRTATVSLPEEGT